jgi:hypothetical protein
MAGEIQIVGIEQRGGSGQAPQHRRLQVVHHDLKEGKGVLVAGEELLHGLGEGELHIPHAAVAEHHDKERQLAAGFAHGHRAVVAPVDLGALAGGEGQGQEGRGPAWTHRAHVILHDVKTSRMARSSPAARAERARAGGVGIEGSSARV